MSTKDYCLPSNGNGNDFGIDTLNDQYNNLNLNQNNYGTNLTFVQSKTVINHAKKFTNYDNLTDKNDSKAKYNSNLNSWNKSPNLLNVQNYSDKKGFPTNDSKNSNRSTLSLHISAYENSVKEISAYSGLKKEKSNLIQPFFAVGFTIQNPFEFPRQQENEKSKKPGIMQFKASQRLLNPNQTSGYLFARQRHADYCKSQEEGYYADSLNGTARKQYEDVISLSMYADGIKIKKSSVNELWILGATVLDLPLKIRSSQKNFVIIAAWNGPIKPIWSIMSDKINEQLSTYIPVGENRLSIAVLQVNADIPARASLLNCMQSGYCPCLRCDVKGKRVGDSMQYPEFEYNAATSATYLQDIKKSENAQSLPNSQKGVAEVCAKGPVAFTSLFVPECVTSDVMHTVYYGPIHDDLKCLLKNKVLIELFDEVIATTLWPSELKNRKLRSISEINLYKASEWKTLILYITVPILSKFLLDSKNISDTLKKQCENILHGVSALLLLMKDVVSEADIYKSKNLLKKWFENRKDIWPHNPYTLKAHDITHFPEQVRIHGPLQSSSCFAGENILNKISNMITSNHSDIILKQVGERSLQEIQIAEWKTQQETGPLKQLILTMDDKSNRINETLPSDSKLTREMGVSNCFKKVKIGGYEFGSSCICKTEKNSYCIFTYQNMLRFGSIEYIAEANGETFVQIQPYHCEPLNNLQEIEFDNYFKIDKKLGDPIICNSKLIHKKGLVITQHVVHIFVPLAHVYEHN